MNDKYLKYDAVELAQEDAFIRWVQEEGGRRSQEWEAWLARHPEKQREVDEARLLVQAIAIKEEAVSQGRVDKLWDRIDAATKTPAQASPARPMAYRWLGYAAAAALALLAAFFFLRPDSAVTVKTAYGQITEHRLPDGSTVRLNAGSTIRYHANEWNSARQLSLEGEAFFEVEKGKPFKVITPKGEVEVLGTSFNINTFEGHFDVQCYTGRVQVSANGSQEILTAGQLAQWEESAWQRATFDTDGGPGWQRGRFEYHSAPLREVFAEMERQFDIRIDAPDSILARTYTGAFERQALDSALYRVCWPMKLNAERRDNKVSIRPEENID